MPLTAGASGCSRAARSSQSSKAAYRMDRMGVEERTIRPAADWRPGADYQDIRYELAEGIAKITIDRPEVRNAFRPETVIELSDAFNRAREDTSVGVIILTGQGPLFRSDHRGRQRALWTDRPPGRLVGRRLRRLCA